MRRNSWVFTHRLLAYALVTIGTIACYFILYAVVSWLIVAFTGQSNSTLVMFVAAVLATSGFWLLRSVLFGSHDRNRYEINAGESLPRQFLDKMSDKFAGVIHLQQLGALIGDSIPAQMRATWGGLMVLTEDGSAMEMLSGKPLKIPLKLVVENWLVHSADPILRSKPQEWVSTEILNMMERRNVALIAPLCVGEEVVGMLGLGPRKDGAVYTETEVKAVKILARQAALAVHNALLVRQMESNQRDLEQEVKRRTEAMMNDRNRLNAILQNMADALLVTSKDGRILLTNPSFEHMIRHSARQLLGQPLNDVLVLPALKSAIRDALAVPGQVHITNIALEEPMLDSSSSKDARELDQRILRAMVTALGDRSAVISILHDITREVELDRMKSEFISTVSHELRTPLTSVLGFAKLTRRSFERDVLPALENESNQIQDSVKRICQNLDIIVIEGRRLTDLINDVLDVSELDAGTMPWHDRVYALPALITRVVDRLREAAEAKRLKIEVTLDPLPALCADPERIEQVLSNLLSNAIKFTNQGQIAITARFIESDRVVGEGQIPRGGWIAPTGGAVLVSVRDTGVGICPSLIPRLFEPFQQGGDPMHSKPKGTGLGLVISHEIVTHYGGEIWVESEVGTGSTFYFTLPLGTSD